MQSRGAVEIDDVDSDRGGEASRYAPTVDLGDEVVHGDVLPVRDVVQGIPHRRFEANAGPVSTHDDVVDRKRGWCAGVVAARPPRQ